jgi:transcription elongation factor Elf1
MADLVTQGYILTFRCINCGRHEASASHPSQEVLPPEQIRDQIYQALCRACGWRSEVCGISAVEVGYFPALKANAAGVGSSAQ